MQIEQTKYRQQMQMELVLEFADRMDDSRIINKDADTNIVVDRANEV